MRNERQQCEDGKANAAGARELPEADAILRAQKGDAAAFERLYQLHSRRVYALCLRMVSNPVEAEDLTQDAFLQLFRKIHTFRGESGFSTWLHRLTVNIVLMRFRKLKRVELPLEDVRDDREESGRAPIDPGAEDLGLSGLIDRVNLARAVERLPEGYKQMFILHDVEGYEHNEIAEILGCSVGNSKSQLHKARVKLRQMLREEVRNQAREGREAAARKTAPRPIAVAQAAPVDAISTSLKTSAKGKYSHAWNRGYRLAYGKL
jgi:RNA polymerase sigma-70 factor, ECF subfamily